MNFDDLKDFEKEILYNIVNSLLAGGLVFLGGLSSGSLSWHTVTAATIAAGIVALTKFREYWTGKGKIFKGKKAAINGLFDFL